MGKRIAIITLIAAIVVAIPFVAMLVTDEVNWGTIDFVIAFALLLTPGLIYELIISKIKNKNLRYGSLAVLILLLVLVWAQLAVGIL